MKIGMICYPTYGGSGIVATELGLALASHGHEVHFISYATPMRLNHFHENIYYHEVEIPNYPAINSDLYTLALTGKIIDVVKYEELEILHMHYAIPHAISGILSKDILNSANIKIITTLHGTDITLVGLEPAFLPIISYSINRSDAVTAVSRHLKEKTVQSFSPVKDIEVIPNFIDTEEYKRQPCPKIRKQIAPNNEKILMHISNFRPVKRVTDCIKILVDVLHEVSAKMVFVGDGPERKSAERLTRDMNLSHNVVFLGKQSALVELLSAADIFLLPSQSESFGLAALEAMSCSVPVVASNIGGIPEVVSHGENGFVAELGDTQRMAKYIIDLLKNDKKYKMFAEKARKSSVEKYDINKIVPLYEKLYLSV